MKVKDIDFIKVAATIDNKDAVDAILSLGYLKEDTVSLFVDRIDQLKEAESLKLVVSTKQDLELVPGWRDLLRIPSHFNTRFFDK